MKILRFSEIMLAVLLSALMIISPVSDISAQGISDSSLKEYAEGIVKYEKSVLGIPAEDSLFSGKFLEYAGRDSADWFVIGASRMGLDEDYESYYYAFAENLSENKDDLKATDWQRYTLTALSCGGDPEDINGINAPKKGVYGGENPGRQGLNGWIWALIALNSYGFETPENGSIDRDRIIDEIISSQLPDGGFALGGDAGDCDLTAMAVQALSVHTKEREDVKDSVEKAIDFLSRQLSEKGFENCETVAQTLCALCCADIDYSSDERFTADGNLLERLLEYRNADGGFSHIKGEDSDPLASSQALLALAAVYRYENGMCGLYDFSGDFTPRTYTFDKAPAGENQREINAINAEIMQGLYPFEKLDGEQKKRLEELYERTLKLPESDRKKITGYEKMKEICESKLSAKTIISAVSLLIIISLTAVLLIKRSKGEKK